MFNRQPYNRGKFNAPSVAISSNSGIAVLKLDASVTATHIISVGGQAENKMNGGAIATVVKYSTSSAVLTMSGAANGAKVFIVDAGAAALVMLTEANHQISGEQVMRFEDLVLKPGDELVINTCDLTVTLNGLNAMEYFAADSDFITLLNGRNTIEYNDESGTRNISFDIIWKDRWL
jgi:hypothetical protein